MTESQFPNGTEWRDVPANQGGSIPVSISWRLIWEPQQWHNEVFNACCRYVTRDEIRESIAAREGVDPTSVLQRTPTGRV